MEFIDMIGGNFFVFLGMTTPSGKTLRELGLER